MTSAIRLQTLTSWSCTLAVGLAVVWAVIVPAEVLAQSSKTAGGKASSEVAELRRRVEQLEQQLVDVQVVLGTLETLARSGGGSAATSGAALSGGDAGRLAALETQVRALTAQLQQRGGAPARQSSSVQGWRGTDQTKPAPSASGSTLPSGGGFGSTTVQSGSGATIGGLIQNDRRSASNAVQGSSLPAVGGNPQAEYEAAYGLLLQQDYGAARAAFQSFVKAHRNHSLAGNAQYWLGETYYVQGQYKSAAGAFLTGYRTYKSSPKAPDSLLKLAMSLDRLGQRAAACSSLSELGAKYPQAPQHVTRRVGQEIRRLRC